MIEDPDLFVIYLDVDFSFEAGHDYFLVIDDEITLRIENPMDVVVQEIFVCPECMEEFLAEDDYYFHFIQLHHPP